MVVHPWKYLPENEGHGISVAESHIGSIQIAFGMADSRSEVQASHLRCAGKMGRRVRLKSDDGFIM